ncbi:hypothetical protein C7M84_001137 [Penaeus vannamei]|uniref:Uncharacterized protein n=1 Tax=Penaeus vannamei TaxID=6689 RepID=A0A3R7PAI0_PENVA|nr:hypothetical protein C7M84_001137 [Penaeus vannamei]
MRGARELRRTVASFGIRRDNRRRTMPWETAKRPGPFVPCPFPCRIMGARTSPCRITEGRACPCRITEGRTSPCRIMGSPTYLLGIMMDAIVVSRITGRIMGRITNTQEGVRMMGIPGRGILLGMTMRRRVRHREGAREGQERDIKGLLRTRDSPGPRPMRRMNSMAEMRGQRIPGHHMTLGAIFLKDLGQHTLLKILGRPTSLKPPGHLISLKVPSYPIILKVLVHQIILKVLCYPIF